VYLTWAEMGTGRRVWEAVGGALVLGLICGLALGASGALYAALTVVAVLGAIVGGSQHEGLGDALLRGLTGGTTFGLAVLLGFELGGGTDAVVELPEPAILLLLFTALPALPLNALGFRSRSALRAKLA
jgi:hypothetical protein